MVLCNSTSDSVGFSSLAAPVAKFGSFVIASDSKGQRVKLSYDDTDAILDSLKVRRRARAKEIFESISKADCCRDIGVSITESSRYRGLKPSSSAQPAGVVTGTNLPEVLLEVGGFVCLARSTFSVCADDDSFGLVSEGDLNLHSKVWTRFILVGKAGDSEPTKLWGETDAIEFISLMASIKEPVQQTAVSIYKKAVMKASKETADLRAVHEMSFASYGVSRAAFNKLVSALPKSELMAFRQGQEWQKGQAIVYSSGISSLADFANRIFDGELDKTSANLKRLIDRANKKYSGKTEYNVVAIDNDRGIRGLFISETDDTKDSPDVGESKFVGVAADPSLVFHSIVTPTRSGQNLTDGKIKPSHSPSNAALTILAEDIAAGL